MFKLMRWPAAPFTLTRGTSPLLVSFPHSGLHLPKWLESRLTEPGKRLMDTDWHVPELYGFLHRKNVTIACATYSRYVIDVNRPSEQSESLYPGQATTEVVPTTTFDGRPLYLEGMEPDEADLQDRIANVWEIYHLALRREIERLKAIHGFAIIYDAHSIRSRVPRLFEGQLPTYNLGTVKGRSCDLELQTQIEAIISEESHVVNGRFIGGHITRSFGDPSKNVHAIQMELAQCDYMEEISFKFDPEKASRMQECLEKIIDTILLWKPEDSKKIINRDHYYVSGEGVVRNAIVERDVALEIKDGVIQSVISQSEKCSTIPTLHLDRQLIFPGFVNVHSHAFQRALRGQGETYPPGAQGSFWTWRNKMYEIVGSMDSEQFYAICKQCFTEMLHSGITTVGEFHYLHHLHPEEGNFEFDRAVLCAAKDAGIRIVLQITFYKSGGFGVDLNENQQRFSTPSVKQFFEHIDSLREELCDHQSIAIAAHSVRAVPRDDLKLLIKESRDRGLQFFMHIEEQPKEIEDCFAATSLSPTQLLLSTIDENQDCNGITTIHNTFTSTDDLDEFLRRGGRVCVCPLTEGSLGDGICDAKRMGNKICLGSDCNARIDMFEEMRWLEYGQRLIHNQRGVLATEENHSVATELLNAATIQGAKALGIRAGEIEVGCEADFFTVCADHPILKYHNGRIVESLIFGGSAELIENVCVAGNWTNRTK